MTADKKTNRVYIGRKAAFAVSKWIEANWELLGKEMNLDKTLSMLQTELNMPQLNKSHIRGVIVDMDRVWPFKTRKGPTPGRKGGDPSRASRVLAIEIQKLQRAVHRIEVELGFSEMKQEEFDPAMMEAVKQGGINALLASRGQQE